MVIACCGVSAPYIAMIVTVDFIIQVAVVIRHVIYSPCRLNFSNRWILLLYRLAETLFRKLETLARMALGRGGWEGSEAER